MKKKLYPIDLSIAVKIREEKWNVEPVLRKALLVLQKRRVMKKMTSTDLYVER